MQVKKEELEPDMEQWTSSVLGKEYIKVVILSPCLINLCRLHHVKCRTG